MDPSLAPMAVSIARFMAHTMVSENPTPVSPMQALSVACRRFPFQTFHNQRKICMAEYLVSGFSCCRRDGRSKVMTNLMNIQFFVAKLHKNNDILDDSALIFDFFCIFATESSPGSAWCDTTEITK